MKRLTFAQLVRSICSVHQQLSVQAVRSINMSLTLRNWLIGMYTAEFELPGADTVRTIGHGSGETAFPSVL